MTFPETPIGSHRFGTIQTLVLERAAALGLTCTLVRPERQVYRYMEGPGSLNVLVGISRSGASSDMNVSVREGFGYLVPMPNAYMVIPPDFKGMRK